MPLRVEWSGSRLYKFIHSQRRASSSRYDIYVRSRATSRLTLFLPLRPPVIPIAMRRPRQRRALRRARTSEAPLLLICRMQLSFLPFSFLTIRSDEVISHFYIDHSYASLLSPILDALRNCQFESAHKLSVFNIAIR